MDFLYMKYINYLTERHGKNLRWPTRVTTHYFTTNFEILSAHFKLCTTHSNFLETHFEFATNSEIFTIHFKISATDFEISATLSPQDPKCWQRKGSGYAAPPTSFDAIFWSTCGQQLQEICFCPQMSPMEAATLTAKKMIFSKHTFWLVLSTTPLLASSKSSTAFTFQVTMLTFQWFHWLPNCCHWFSWGLP